MDEIGTAIGKYILPPPALQSLENFMQCVIQKFEMLYAVLESDVNVGELQTPSTEIIRKETMSMGIAQQFQADIEGQKMVEYCNDFGQKEGKSVNRNVTGIGTGVGMEQISQALCSKEFNSIVNTAPNIIQNAGYIQNSLENLVSIGKEVGKRAEIIKIATGETNPLTWQIPTYFGRTWDVLTNKALAIPQLVPDNLTKRQSEITETLINRVTAVNKAKNENMVAMEQRQVEINDTLSSPQTSLEFSLPMVENYGETIVGGMADTPMSLGTSDEDLKYIRGAAQSETINNFTTAQIAVDFKNNATINSELDIDLVMNKFTEKLREAVDTCAEGVNYCV